MKRLFILVLLALIVPCTFAQAQPAQAPKPGPEVQQLAQFLGTWQCGFENKTGTQTKGEYAVSVDWAAGGFFLVWKTAAPNEMTVIWGYNAEEKAYWSFRYASNGNADFSRGWVNGNTWNFVFENELAPDGKARRRQVTFIFDAPTQWNYQWERSVEGAPWVTTQVGKCNKAK